MDLRFALSSLVALVGAGLMAAVAGRRSPEQDLHGKQTWPEEDKQQALVFARRGMSASAIARRIGMTPKTVMRYMRQAGIPVRPRGRWMADKEKVLELIRQGVSAREISQRIGMSHSQVRNYMHAAGVPVARRPPRVKLTEETKQQVLEFARRGMVLREIAERTGVSRPVVTGLVRAAGIPVRPRGSSATTPTPVEQILALAREGVSTHEISNRVRVSRSRVVRIIRREGIPVRGPRGADAARRDNVAEAVALGFKQDEIVRLLDEDPIYVGYVIAQDRRDAPRWTKVQMDAAMAEVARGMSVYAAAWKHGIPEPTLRYRLRVAKSTPSGPSGG